MLQIRDYADARMRVDQFLDKQGIPKNDNKVGRIGEYYAKTFFDNAKVAIEFAENPITPYDIKNKKTGKLYSVKTITPENKGQSTEFKLNGEWDYLLLIILDKELRLKGRYLLSYNRICKYALSTNKTLIPSSRINNRRLHIFSAGHSVASPHKKDFRPPAYKLRFRSQTLIDQVVRSKIL